MKNLTISSLTLLLLFAFTFASAQSIRGAWEFEKVTVTNQDGETVYDDLRPGLMIFLNKHYAMTIETAERELLPEGVSRSTMTLEQWKNMGINYVSNSGAYEIEGNKLIMRPTVAFSPNFMDGRSATCEFERKGNTLSLTYSGGEGDNSWKRVEVLKKVE